MLKVVLKIACYWYVVKHINKSVDNSFENSVLSYLFKFPRPFVGLSQIIEESNFLRWA